MLPKNPNFFGRELEVQKIIATTRTFRLITLYGLPGSGKTTIALEVLRRLQGAQIIWCTEDTASDELEKNASQKWLVLDSVDSLSPTAMKTLSGLVATRTAGWIATSRRRLNLPNEAGIPIGHLPFKGLESTAAILLRHFLSARAIHLAPLDLARIAELSEGQVAGLVAATDQIELLGSERFLSAEMDFFRTRLVDLHIEHLKSASTPEIQSLCDLSVLSSHFDSSTFEALTQNSTDVLKNLIEQNLVEKINPYVGRFWVPPLLGIASRRLGLPDEDRLERHAKWALKSGGREELLSVARNAMAGAVKDLGLGVSAVAQLCLGPAPPTEALEWAIHTARTTAHEDLAELLVHGAKAALRRSEITAAQLLADEAEVILGDSKTANLQQLRASITRIISPGLAVEEYERSLELPGGQSPLILLNHATALWESGEHQRAQIATERALARAQQDQDVHLEGLILSSLGVMNHNAGRFDEARDLHSRAMTCHEVASNSRFIAIAKFDIASIDHEQGALEAALGGYTDAIFDLETVHDLRMSHLARAALAGVEAQLGIPATQSLASLRCYFEDVGDATFAEACELYEQIDRICRGVSVAEHRPSNFSEVGPYEHKCDELQIPSRILGRLALAIGSETALIVDTTRRKFRLSGETMDLESREAYRNIFQLLIHHRLVGRPYAEIGEILSAGWPEEIIEAEAAKNRLHVSLSALRKLGLRSVLVKVGAGYGLDRSVPVIQVS